MPEKKKTAVPRLRFPEFRDAGPWEVKRLGDIANVYQPETISQSRLSNDGEFLVYGANGIIGRFDRYNHEEPQIAITCRGSTCGEVTLTQPRSWITGNSMVVNVENSKDALRGFLYYQLKGTDWRYLITGSGQPQITGEIKKHKVALPSKNEQQEIADCLGSLDDLIRAEEARLEALRQHKKGLMQQLFPREGETTPRLRFPEFRDAGPWEVKRLGAVFGERNERNAADLELLSVTMSDGVVLASDLERRNNASSDRSNYKKVYPNDIVYNSMRMWQGASGVSYWKGIVSPAYTVVTPAENQNPVFWAYYFKLPHVIEKFACFSQGVTSDTWNLKYPAFSAIRLSFPLDPFEQQKIANCLASLDDLIRAQGERIETLKQHKKGLMQQLFPQEVG